MLNLNDMQHAPQMLPVAVTANAWDAPKSDVDRVSLSSKKKRGGQEEARQERLALAFNLRQTGQQHKRDEGEHTKARRNCWSAAMPDSSSTAISDPRPA